MMIINLTQHPATPDQTEAGVVDLPPDHRAALVAALTVDTLPSMVEIQVRCARIAELAVQNGLGGDDADDPHPTQAMIGGAPWMMRALEDALVAIGIQPVYAFSVRQSTEITMPDGTVQKVNSFKHVGFVHGG